MEHVQSKEVWAAGAYYEPYVGRWKGHSRVSGISGPDFGIQRIDPAGLDPNQDLTRSGHGTRYFRQDEGTVIALQDQGTHALSL